MNKSLKLIFIFLSFVTTFQVANAQGIRTYSNEFLSLGVGARAFGMGNAVGASTSDVSAAYWNPAGLNSLENFQVAAMHAEWFAGIAKYDYLSAGLPIADKKRSAAITAIRFGVDDIPNTLFILEPDGSVNYDNITTFSAADYAFLLSYAQKIGPIDIGFSTKIIHRRVGKFATAWGVGLDLGARYIIKEKFTLGLTLKDFPVTFNTWGFNFTQAEKEILDITGNVIPVNSVELTGQRIILAAAYRATIGEKFGILTEVNLDFTTDGKRNVLLKSNAISMDPHVGIELDYDQLVFLRFGINNIQKFTDDTGKNITSIQPNAGLGLKIREVQIDYAFTGLNRISDNIYSHIISLRIDFKKKAKVDASQL